MSSMKIGTMSCVNWLTLDAVAIRLAEEILTDEPPKNLVSNPDAHQTTWKSILIDFRELIESEEVTVRLNTPNGFTKLNIDKALHKFTEFDFSNGTVCVEGKVEWTFEARVKSKELDLHLKSNSSTRHGYKTRQDRERACREWLEKTLPNTKRGNREKIHAEAREKFDVFKNFVERAWKVVIEELGLQYLSQRGRTNNSF